MNRTRSVVALGLGFAVLVLAQVLAEPPEPVAFGRPDVDVVPTVDGADGGRTWYCAGGSADGSDTDVSYVVTNLGDQLRTATISVVLSAGSFQTTTVPVEPHESVTVPASSVAASPTAAAIVEVDGDHVAVEHQLGPAQAAPCASAPSQEWYLANGSTAPGATELLYVFNPFPDPAVVTITAATEGGLDAPRSLDALPVRGQSVLVVDLGQHVLRRETVAAMVEVRSGHVVVDRIQRFDGSTRPAGREITLAASASASVWRFADGGAGAESTETWHVLNPGPNTASISLGPVPDSGGSLNAVDQQLAPGAQLTLTATDLGVAGLTGYSMTVTSGNDNGIVVERTVDGRSTTRRGWTSSLGAPVSAQRWAFGAGSSSTTVDESISVLNPGAQAVTVRFLQVTPSGLVPIAGLDAVVLAPAQRTQRALGGLIQASPLPVVVEADGEVVVARTLAQVGGTGASEVMGMPWP